MGTNSQCYRHLNRDRTLGINKNCTPLTNIGFSKSVIN